MKPARIALALSLALSPPALAGPAAKPAPQPAPQPAAKAAEPVPKARPRGNAQGEEPQKSKEKLPTFLGLFGPQSFIRAVGFRGSPGAYAEFETTPSARIKGAPPTAARFAEVGPPPAKDARWIEFTPLRAGEELVIRIQVRGNDDGNVQRLLLKPPGYPAMEFPVERYEVIDKMDAHAHDDDGADGADEPRPESLMAAPIGKALPSNALVRAIGSEKVTTPAGAFDCEHWVAEAEGVRQDFWVTKDPRVPFTGVVKIQTEDGTSVLKRLGNDAKPAIDPPQRNR